MVKAGHAVSQPVADRREHPGLRPAPVYRPSLDDPRPRVGGAGRSAADLDPGTRGLSWLLAEGGVPTRVRAAFLTDDRCTSWPPACARLERRRERR
jgi:hypothetical protein